jgi:hypothetical protein
MHQLQRSWLDLSIRRHSGIWGAADEAVLNSLRKKKFGAARIRIHLYDVRIRLQIILSTYHQAKIVRKTVITTTVFCGFFMTFYPWKITYVNVVAKKRRKNILVAILKVTE